jgi:hypothetical protein
MRKGPTLGLTAAAWLVSAIVVALVPNVLAQPAAPLPDAESFLAPARAKLIGNDLMQSRFSYRERSTRLNLNPFGRIGTGPTVVAEVYPLPGDGLTYRRIVERDGKPLSPDEVARQDREYREKFEAWQRRLAREGQSAREARLRKDAELRAREQKQMAEALDLFNFTLVGRSTWEGEPALVVAFTPKPNAKARSREGRVAEGFAGRAWVHEFEHELLHVNAIAVEDVTFGFGMIARLNKGSVVEFTRRRVHGMWFPVETRFQGTGSALIFRRVVFDYTRTYWDYRPFSAEELPDRLGWK